MSPLPEAAWGSIPQLRCPFHISVFCRLPEPPHHGAPTTHTQEGMDMRMTIYEPGPRHQAGEGPSEHNHLASAGTSPASCPGSLGPRQDRLPLLASVPPGCTTHRVGASVARPAGTPHLTGKRLHQAVSNAAKSVNTPWASRRSRLSDLMKLLLPHLEACPGLDTSLWLCSWAGAKQGTGSGCLWGGRPAAGLGRGTGARLPLADA